MKLRPLRASRGFTLAELLIVVAIIAVLVAIAIPVFGTALEKSRAAVCMANRRSLLGEVRVQEISENVESDAAFASIYTFGASQYTCPDGGVFSWDRDHVKCSKHPNGETVQLGGGAYIISPSKDITDITELANSGSTVSLTKGKLYSADGKYYVAAESYGSLTFSEAKAYGAVKAVSDVMVYTKNDVLTNGAFDGTKASNIPVGSLYATDSGIYVKKARPTITKEAFFDDPESAAAAEYWVKLGDIA